MPDLPFEPINRSHSLAELVLIIEFATPMSSVTLQRAGALKAELSSILPRAEDIQGFQVVFANGIAETQTQPPGLQMSSYKPDGTIKAMLRVAENLISIHWLEYEGWSSSRKVVQKILDAVLMRIRGGNLVPSSIGLKFIDQFLCQDETIYDIKRLINVDDPDIPRSAFGGVRWHSHVGSYTSGKTVPEVLSVLNIDSTKQFLPARIFINIDHTLSVRATDPADLVPYMSHSGTGQEWTDLLDEFHTNNKERLRNLLTAEVQDRIGLSVDAKGSDAHE